MEDEGFLNPLNEIHLSALHFVYLSKIKEKLQIWSRAWSYHRMRTTRRSPIQMWVSGQIQNPTGIELTGEAIPNYGVEGIVQEDRTGHSLSFVLSDQCKQQLNDQIPAHWRNHEVDHYIKAVNIIKHHNSLD